MNQVAPLPRFDDYNRGTPGAGPAPPQPQPQQNMYNQTMAASNAAAAPPNMRGEVEFSRMQQQAAQQQP